MRTRAKGAQLSYSWRILRSLRTLLELRQVVEPSQEGRGGVRASTPNGPTFFPEKLKPNSIILFEKNA